MVNETRNLHGELLEGLTDGLVVKLLPNRGGSVTADRQSAEAAVFAERYVPWVREWTPSAMREAQHWAEGRIAGQFG